VALLYQGQAMEEQQKMGERLAFYQAAVDKLSEATKLAKGLDLPEVFLSIAQSKYSLMC
jgi:tyrosine-protein phosphatase non-receptor type 23